MKPCIEELKPLVVGVLSLPTSIKHITHLNMLALCALMYVQLTHQFHPTFMPFDYTKCSLQWCKCKWWSFHNWEDGRMLWAGNHNSHANM
jgi:hypothetical protein